MMLRHRWKRPASLGVRATDSSIFFAGATQQVIGPNFKSGRNNAELVHRHRSG
jgi:hypothetical protein